MVALKAQKIYWDEKDYSTTAQTSFPIILQQDWKKSKVKKYGPRDFHINIYLTISSTSSRVILRMRLQLARSF